MITRQEAEIVLRCWSNNGLVDVRINDMSPNHRRSYRNKLFDYSRDRLEGMLSKWYDTGYTIGELIDILERANVRDCARQRIAKRVNKHVAKTRGFVSYE